MIPARRTLVAGLAMAVLGAGQASAALRYASPAGGGAGPCVQAAPCTLSTAIDGAATGDTVRVLPGTHTTTAPLEATVADLVVEADDPAQRPSIQYAGSAGANVVHVVASGVTLRNLLITGTLNGGDDLVVTSSPFTGTVIDRTELRNLGTARAFVGAGATIRDSVVYAATASGAGVALTGTIVGSTIIADGAAAKAVEIDQSTTFTTGHQTLTVRNSIIRGGGSDIRLFGAAGHSVTLDIDYSAYDQSKLHATGTAVANQGTHNVHVAPQLVGEAGAADIHQAPGSPTIDTGLAISSEGSGGDIDGNPRIVNAAADIGADEYVPAPTVTSGALSAITPTSGTLSGWINPNGLVTSYRIEYGPTNAYGSSTPEIQLPVGVAPVWVAVSITGLSPSTTVHLRLVARNATGTSVGANTMFATLAQPTAPITPSLSPPTLGRLRFDGTRARSGRRTVLRFSLSEDSTVTATVAQILRGRTAGKACRAGATSGRRCTRLVTRGIVTTDLLKASAGAILVIPSRVGARTLAPGRYRISVSAKAFATGLSSATRTATLVVR